MGWLIVDAGFFGAGFLTHMFWGSTIRPWLLNETHVIISGAEAQTGKLIDAIKKKL